MSPGCRAAAGVSRTVAATLEGLMVWGAKPAAPTGANNLPGAADCMPGLRLRVARAVLCEVPAYLSI